MSAQSLLAPSAGPGNNPSIDYGWVKGQLLATGTVNLVAGTATITPGFPLNGPLASSSVFALPAALPNIPVGAVGTPALPAGTVSIVAGAAGPTGLITTFTINSTNAADVNLYRWFVYA